MLCLGTPKPTDGASFERVSKDIIRPNIVEHSFPASQVPLDHFTAIYAPLPNYTQYRSGPMIIPIILGNITMRQPVYQMLSTVVLVRDGENNTCNILVDTGLPIDRNILVAGLATHGIHLNQVHYVVLTHGHPDHIGNLNLFPASRSFFGRLGMRGHTFIEYRESVGRNGQGKLVNLCKHSRIYATAGHTSSDLSLVVNDVQGYGTVAITGDLFASENDFGSGEIWQKFSSFPRHQERNRRMILCISDVVFPGHGHPFRVSSEIRQLVGCPRS
ncbi:Lactamase B domain containing protein [Trichuris trichiura]|uniref:Metallo-beta-lactamase domain-containing protein 1 n=1 Tax=Trichuris trichiura TaxID=36087 RepID=A0A077Z240_TRITR|nr:Lactamase B domain containing protein [Trichuris trichiura]